MLERLSFFQAVAVFFHCNYAWKINCCTNAAFPIRVVFRCSIIIATTTRGQISDPTLERESFGIRILVLVSVVTFAAVHVANCLQLNFARCLCTLILKYLLHLQLLVAFAFLRGPQSIINRISHQFFFYIISSSSHNYLPFLSNIN
jgi:hypothetical protein